MFPLVLVTAALVFGRAVPVGQTTAVGSISSSSAITINGSEIPPSIAPSWPVAPKDEISTSGPAVLQTTNYDVVTFDARTRARIDANGKGAPYIFVRDGGVGFETKADPVYICIDRHLYIPDKASKGGLRLDKNSKVVNTVVRGSFLENGRRSCDEEASAGFLRGLPGGAGGVIGGGGGGGGATAAAVAGVGAAVGGGVAAASAFGGSNPNSCASTIGCNFNAAPISAP